MQCRETGYQANEDAKVDDNNPIFIVELKTFDAGPRTFVHACIKVGSSVIGDMDQAVLIGSFRLAISDAMRRLSSGAGVAFTEDADFSMAFKALYDAAWNGKTKAISSLLGRKCTSEEAMRCVAIPTGIETFDGEQGFSFVIGKTQCFCWRDWESKRIRMVPIQRSHIASAFSAALTELGVQ